MRGTRCENIGGTVLNEKNKTNKLVKQLIGKRCGELDRTSRREALVVKIFRRGAPNVCVKANFLQRGED